MGESDGELLAAWRAGDRVAGNALFNRHFASIHRFFVNKVDRGVEDLVQRTFMACVEAKHRIEGRSSFRTFLFGIAHNLLRETYRKRRREEIDFERDSVVDLGAGPSTLLTARQEEGVLIDALRKIPLEHQVVLELYYWEDLTGTQLGELLGVPENTARSRLRRAKMLLADVIAAMPAPPEVLQRTSEDIDSWAAAVRKHLDREAT